MRSARRDFGSVIVGFGLAAAGALFLANNLGFVNAEDYLVYWPAVFVVLGVADLARQKFFGALIWLAVGSILLASNLGYLAVEIWDLWGLWPLLLVAIGMSLVRQSLQVVPKDIAANRASTFRSYVLMGGGARKINSSSFLGGDACAVMGGTEIDLRRARVENGEAVIDVCAFWGGIEIRVPDDWEVIDQVTQLLGGVENKTDLPDNPRVKLIVRGAAVMGGVEIKN